MFLFLIFCNHFSFISSHLTCIVWPEYPAIKFVGVFRDGKSWKFIVQCSHRPHNCKGSILRSLPGQERLQNVEKWKTLVQGVQKYCFPLLNMPTSSFWLPELPKVLLTITSLLFLAGQSGFYFLFDVSELSYLISLDEPLLISAVLWLLELQFPFANPAGLLCYYPDLTTTPQPLPSPFVSFTYWVAQTCMFSACLVRFDQSSFYSFFDQAELQISKRKRVKPVALRHSRLSPF